MNRSLLKYISTILITITLGMLGFFASNIIPDQYAWMSWAIITAAFLYLNIYSQSSINKLYNSLLHDPLTNLKNRRYFKDELTDDLSEMRLEESGLSFLMIDIDNFKVINDTNGHPAGDEVLKQFANILTGCLRKNDIIVRWGGEEFAVVLPGTEIDLAVIIAERIRHAAEGYDFCYKDIKMKLTVSIGVATAEERSEIDELVQIADHALYEAKKKRNLVCAA